MHFNQFIEWAFLGLISGGMMLTIAFLHRLNESVDTLNETIASLIEKAVWHEKVLDKHDERISNLEKPITKRRK